MPLFRPRVGQSRRLAGAASPAFRKEPRSIAGRVGSSPLPTANCRYAGLMLKRKTDPGHRARDHLNCGERMRGVAYGLGGLAVGAHEATAHSLPVDKAGFPGNFLDRQPAVLA